MGFSHTCRRHRPGAGQRWAQLGKAAGVQRQMGITWEGCPCVSILPVASHKNHHFNNSKMLVQWFLALPAAVLLSVLITGSLHPPVPNKQLLPAAAPPAPGNHSLFSVSGLACSGHFIYVMESCNMSPSRLVSFT